MVEVAVSEIESSQLTDGGVYSDSLITAKFHRDSGILLSLDMEVSASDGTNLATIMFSMNAVDISNHFKKLDIFEPEPEPEPEPIPYHPFRGDVDEGMRANPSLLRPDGGV